MRDGDELGSLAVAATAGDAHAARTLLTAVGGTILRAVRKVLGAKHPEVADVTQDAMVGLIEALPRFRGECKVAHFAGRIAILTAMAALRRQQVRDRWLVCNGSPADRIEAGPESSPLAQLEADRRRSATARLLHELPGPIAEAMALHYVLGHTVAEIAAVTHVPVNTVWSRLRIGKQRLREKLFGDARLFEDLANETESAD